LLFINPPTAWTMEKKKKKEEKREKRKRMEGGGRKERTVMNANFLIDLLFPHRRGKGKG